MIKSFQWLCLIFLSMVMSVVLSCVWFKENIVAKIFISRKRRRKIKELKANIEKLKETINAGKNLLARLEKELRWLGGK